MFRAITLFGICMSRFKMPWDGSTTICMHFDWQILTAVNPWKSEFRTKLNSRPSGKQRRVGMSRSHRTLIDPVKRRSINTTSGTGGCMTFYSKRLSLQMICSELYVSVDSALARQKIVVEPGDTRRSWRH